MPTDVKRIFASPLARRLAGDAGLDLAKHHGQWSERADCEGGCFGGWCGGWHGRGFGRGFIPYPNLANQLESRGGETALPPPVRLTKSP